MPTGLPLTIRSRTTIYDGRRAAATSNKHAIRFDYTLFHQTQLLLPPDLSYLAAVTDGRAGVISHMFTQQTAHH